MAKRKRLSPAQTDYLSAAPPTLETKSNPLARAPIAQVAGEAASAAALEELAGAMQQARDEGRMIQAIDESRVESGYLVRDRMSADDEELERLMDSLRARGQQTPIEVVALEEGRFGLISGWRRLTALRRLLAETGDEKFRTVQAILRRPDSAATAYVAMVEENEIRVGLSYYERARIAAKAVEKEVFTDEKQALLSLFSTASRAKRSKIRSFLTIYHAADDLLRFPFAIGERLGLALSKRLDSVPESRFALRQALQLGRAETAEDEIAILDSALSEPASKASLNKASEPQSEPVQPPVKGEEKLAGGLTAKWNGRSVTLSGEAVSEDFRARLLDWIRANL